MTWIIAVIIILTDCLVEHNLKQDSIREESKEDVQFVRDAVVTYGKLNTPRLFITNIKELDVNHVGIIFEAVVDLDKDWLKKGDIVVLEKDRSEWIVKHDVKKYGGAYRYHLKSFIRSTKHIAAGDTIYRTQVNHRLSSMSFTN